MDTVVSRTKTRQKYPCSCKFIPHYDIMIYEFRFGTVMSFIMIEKTIKEIERELLEGDRLRIG